VNEDAEPRPVQSEHEEEPPYPSPGYAWYVVGVLMVVYVLSFIDRQILSIIAGPVKQALDVGDFAMGLLMGFSFAMFYSILGMPFGWLADRRSRRSIISVGLIVWSTTTTFCVIARQYWQLFLLRVGVGIGEAALSPAAYSLITDYFPRRKLATAISVYGMGIYIGSGLAFILGGLAYQYATTQEGRVWPIIGEVQPWQTVFFIVGVPGLIIAILVYTIREPIRRGIFAGASLSPTTFSEFIAYARLNAGTVLYHHFGFALLAFCGYATIHWITEFFIRNHHWGRSDIAIWYGGVIMVFGSAGITLGGVLSDWLSKRGYRDGKILCGLISAALMLPLGILMPLMPNGFLAMLVICPLAFFQALPFGAAPAAIQEMMPVRMRGQAGAFYLLIVNFFAIGFGPTTVGALTEYVFQDELALGKSLIIVSVFSSIGAMILLSLCRKPFVQSLDRLKNSSS